MLEPGTLKTTLKQTRREFNTLVRALLREYSVNSVVKRKYFLTFAIAKELQKKILFASLSKGSSMTILRRFWIGFINHGEHGCSIPNLFEV